MFIRGGQVIISSSGMQFSSLVSGLTALGVVLASNKPQWYPLTLKGEIPEIKPYIHGQDVFIDCIARNMDTGEHKFDSNGHIIHTAFPACKETGKPLNFHYGVLEDLNCTIEFTDELYHMFQLYVHEDAPLSCRIPLSTEANSVEKGGAYIPLTFNFRGEVHDSHLDIDTQMNLIMVTPHSREERHKTVVSAVAWSSGTRAVRTVIGDSVTLQLAVRWLDNVKNYGFTEEDTRSLPYGDGFYKLPFNTVPISYNQYIMTLILVAFVSGVVSFALSYKIKGGKTYDLLDDEANFNGKQD